MEILTTAVFMLMLVLAVVNWIIASFEKDYTKKIANILAAIYFLLFAIILQIIG
jgi:hypothetical protein